jgi:hypothetical protein
MKFNQVLSLEWTDGAVCDYFSRSQQSLAASQTECSLRKWYKIFKKSKNNFEILGVKRVACNKFRTEGPHILGTTEQNLFAMLIWRPGFVHLHYRPPSFEYVNHVYFK